MYINMYKQCIPYEILAGVIIYLADLLLADYNLTHQSRHIIGGIKLGFSHTFVN